MNIDNDLHIKCYEIPDSSYIKIEDCFLENTFKPTQNTKYFSIRIKNNPIIIENEVEKPKICPENLRDWITEISDPDLFWNKINLQETPINEETNEIEIELDFLKNRKHFGRIPVTITNQNGDMILFRGKFKTVLHEKVTTASPVGMYSPCQA